MPANPPGRKTPQRPTPPPEQPTQPLTPQQARGVVKESILQRLVPDRGEDGTPKALNIGALSELLTDLLLESAGTRAGVAALARKVEGQGAVLAGLTEDEGDAREADDISLEELAEEERGEDSEPDDEDPLDPAYDPREYD